MHHHFRQLPWVFHFGELKLGLRIPTGERQVLTRVQSGKVTRVTIWKAIHITLRSDKQMHECDSGYQGYQKAHTAGGSSVPTTCAQQG